MELYSFAAARTGLPYAYGGSFSPNPRDSTDCSGVAFSAAAILHGLSPFRRYGSTETARLARMNGVPAPCGILPARNAWSIPADAPMRLGFQHGGGGENSHVAVSFFIDGRQYNFESRGYPGVLLNNGARAWNDSLFHDFWYYPGPVGPGDPNAFPLPPGYYFGSYEGPEESISGRAGEPADWMEGLRRWQRAVGVPADGIYGDQTRKAAIDLQLPAGLLPDGKIGPLTWRLGLDQKEAGLSAADADRVIRHITDYINGYLAPVISDVKDLREQVTGSRDLVRFKDGTIDLQASYKGLTQLGQRPDGTNRTLPDAIAALLQDRGLA
ncbi:peptidoglycan-binding protein [Nocardia testacea]|uniref:peptidoglycan-binding domain-containing protein n=1 Tax=Nocardia testacea TaxID=248551 RepID=UPI003A8C4416